MSHMKTLNVLKRVLFAMAAGMLLTHCGSSNTNSNPAAVAGAGYYVSGNTCYNSAGQPVGAATSCPVTTGACGYNTGYGYGTTPGYPYGTTSGYPYGQTGCNGTNQYGTTGYGYGQQCIGNYVYIQNGQMQPIVCQGQCHGVVLYTYPGYQPVQCM